MAQKLVSKVGIPEGVKVDMKGNDLKVSASGKENARNFKSTNFVFKKNGSEIEVWSKSTRRNVVAEANAVASHIRNLITGLNKDYVYRLEVVYSHFPMNVAVKGNYVEINNLSGGKFPRRANIIGSTKVEIKGKDITVKGQNKEHTGQTAANLEQATRIRGRDVRIFQDGIYITSKSGEAKE
ncbi:MAG: 50S ribosomal protein L6 [archaeon]